MYQKPFIGSWFFITSSNILEKRTQEFVELEQNKRIKLCQVQDTCSAVDENDGPLNLSHLGQPQQVPVAQTHAPSAPPIHSQNSHTPPVDSSASQVPVAYPDNKPNYTYTDLITLALRDRASLTVSGIYQWITENFPYYKADDDRWKNSVRHNLSMNPNFRKGGRAKQGTGHVWVLADQSDVNRQVKMIFYLHFMNPVYR